MRTMRRKTRHGLVEGFERWLSYGDKNRSRQPRVTIERGVDYARDPRPPFRQRQRTVPHFDCARGSVTLREKQLGEKRVDGLQNLIEQQVAAPHDTPAKILERAARGEHGGQDLAAAPPGVTHRKALSAEQEQLGQRNSLC